MSTPTPAAARQRETAPGRAWWVGLGIALWLGAALYLVARLSVTHLATFAQPSQPDALAAFASARRQTDAPLLVVHFIAEACSCTNGLFEHLTARASLPGVEEHVVFVAPGSTRQGRAVEAGFRFETLARSVLSDQLGVSAAPVMLVLDGRGELLYLGGYFDHPSASIARDARILDALRGGREIEALPIFGCAVDAVLRQQLDPLALRSTPDRP